MKIENIRINYEQEPLSLEDSKPVFSWEISSEEKNTVQTSYRIVVWYRDGVCWDSGTMRTEQSNDIEYRGADFESACDYTVQLTVTDNHGNTAQKETMFSTALRMKDWRACWIEPELPPITREEEISVTRMVMGLYKKTAPETRLTPCSYLRKEFMLKDKPVQARLFMTTHGIYHVELNGSNVDRRYFAPEFTDYRLNILYQTYDVTERLSAGVNAVGVIIADGWWGGRFGLNGSSCEFGEKHGLLMQLRITYGDGTEEWICSDESFRAGTGKIRYSDISIGEMQDARADIVGWSSAGYDDSGWNNVKKADYDFRILHAQTGPAVHIVKTLPVKNILVSPKKEMILDFGENLAGFVRMKVKADAGTKITLEHSEVLSKDGNFIQNIQGRNKDQTDIYICNGGEEEFEPRFTYHGFRYVRLTGYPSIPEKEDFEAVVLSSVDMVNTFSTSDERINMLQTCIRNSESANFLSIPTDCPQRERAGWTGDIQVFLKTGAFNADVNGILTRWLRDVALEQTEEGAFVHCIPYTKDYRDLAHNVFHSDTSSGWGDAGVILPYRLYKIYGNRKVLEDQYPSMKAWVEYEKREAQKQPKKGKKKKTQAEIERQRYIWNTGYHYGDHLIPSATKRYGVMADSFISKANPLVATAYYAYSSALLAESAKILGYADDAAYYSKLAESVKYAFQEEFITLDGRLKTDWQGCYAIALGFHLVPDSLVDAFLDRLEALIVRNHGCHDCGFLSIEHILNVFSENGRLDKAYSLLYQDKMPSWLYEVDHGATSIWEAWDATKPNGRTGTFSYNHYAFGCVGDWMYKNILGLQSDSVGGRHLVIRPQPDSRLSFAEGTYHGIYGEIKLRWEQKDEFILRIELPANTTATVYLPNGCKEEIGSGKWEF